MKSLARITQLGVACCAFVALSAAAVADSVKVAADLKPTVATSKATGKLNGTFDTQTRELSYKVEYSGLSGPAMAAHFHGPAEPGKDAGVAVPVTGELKSPITSKATLTDAQAADLLAGKYYLNFHTQANPKGELRGQVEKAK
ncbi:MAG: CHRD domain-containing protein [Steroidobacteraceae bacterium]